MVYKAQDFAVNMGNWSERYNIMLLDMYTTSDL